MKPMSLMASEFSIAIRMFIHLCIYITCTCTSLLSVCTAYYKTSCVCQCLWYTKNSLYHIYSDIMFAVYIHCAYCSLLTTVCSSLTFNLSVSVSVLCVSVFVLISLFRYLFVPCVHKIMWLVRCTCQQKKVHAHCKIITIKLYLLLSR